MVVVWRAICSVHARDSHTGWWRLWRWQILIKFCMSQFKCYPPSVRGADLCSEKHSPRNYSWSFGCDQGHLLSQDICNGSWRKKDITRINSTKWRCWRIWFRITSNFKEKTRCPATWEIVHCRLPVRLWASIAEDPESIPDGQIRFKTVLTIVKTLSCRLSDVRRLIVKRELALKKFRKLAGDNWRVSKYICDIQSSDFTLPNKRLCWQLGKVSSVDLTVQQNVFDLKLPDQLPSAMKGNPNYIKQRTPEWILLRSLSPVTGTCSSLHNALCQRTW